jgi:hypothetical protein
MQQHTPQVQLHPCCNSLRVLDATHALAMLLLLLLRHMKAPPLHQNTNSCMPQ